MAFELAPGLQRRRRKRRGEARPRLPPRPRPGSSTPGSRTMDLYGTQQPTGHGTVPESTRILRWGHRFCTLIFSCREETNHSAGTGTMSRSHLESLRVLLEAYACTKGRNHSSSCAYVRPLSCSSAALVSEATHLLPPYLSISACRRHGSPLSTHKRARCHVTLEEDTVVLLVRENGSNECVHVRAPPSPTVHCSKDESSSRDMIDDRCAVCSYVKACIACIRVQCAHWRLQPHQRQKDDR